MLWFIFHNSDVLLEKLEDGSYTIPQGDVCPLDSDTQPHVIEPMDDGEEVRTLMVGDDACISEGQEWCGLRQSYYKLSPALYRKAGKCQEINYWDATTKYCGVCGAPMEMATDISKRCTHCGREIWPQVSVAVIVLIKRDEKILLVRAKNFRSHHFGLVAGFVETGENLEEAVIREVHEETGIEIKNLHYVASQPWPYPCGLMVGYEAEWESGELTLQEEELVEAGWYDKDNLPQLPEPLSIARQLIERWKKENEK